MTNRTRTALSVAAIDGNQIARQYLAGYLVAIGDFDKGRVMYYATYFNRAWSRGYKLACRELGIVPMTL